MRGRISDLRSALELYEWNKGHGTAYSVLQDHIWPDHAGLGVDITTDHAEALAILRKLRKHTVEKGEVAIVAIRKAEDD